MQGRFTIAAKHHISIAEIYETELVDIDKVNLNICVLIVHITFCRMWTFCAMTKTHFVNPEQLPSDKRSSKPNCNSHQQQTIQNRYKNMTTLINHCPLSYGKTHLNFFSIFPSGHCSLWAGRRLLQRWRIYQVTICNKKYFLVLFLKNEMFYMLTFLCFFSLNFVFNYFVMVMQLSE